MPPSSRTPMLAEPTPMITDLPPDSSRLHAPPTRAVHVPTVRVHATPLRRRLAAIHPRVRGERWCRSTDASAHCRCLPLGHCRDGRGGGRAVLRTLHADPMGGRDRLPPPPVPQPVDAPPVSLSYFDIDTVVAAPSSGQVTFREAFPCASDKGVDYSVQTCRCRSCPNRSRSTGPPSGCASGRVCSGTATRLSTTAAR